MSKTLIDLDKALDAVEAEPNLPGEMPAKFRSQFEKLPLDEALRILVALTKSGIRERIKSLSKEPRDAKS